MLWLDFDSRPDCAVAEQTFVVWLKIMDFVTQNDATDVGSDFPPGRNVFIQAMVSNPFMWNFSFSFTNIREPSNLHKFSL